MVVPIKQPDPRFGEQNSKLTGKAEKGTVNRIVSYEIEINYPMDAAPVELKRDGSIKAHAITSPKDIIETMKSFALSDRELLLGLYLNSRDQVIAHHVIHMGTANASLVHPREVFKLAIMKNACSVIIALNHPSGNVDPSGADLKMTQRLTEA